MFNLREFLVYGCLGFGFVYLVQKVIINHINLTEYWYGGKGDDNNHAV